MLRRLRIHFSCLDAQIVAIAKKGLGYGLRDLADAFALLLSTLDDLVVNVGEVHHLLHLPAAQTKSAPQQVLEQKSSEVSKVRRVVDCRSAGVQAHRFTVAGCKRLDAARKSIVEAELGRVRHAARLLRRAW